MAILGRYGNYGKREFEEMLPEESNALIEQVLKLRDQDRDITLHETKAIMRASGARFI